MAKRKPKRKKFELDVAPDIQARVEEIVRLMPEEFGHVDASRVLCFRSRGSTARIYARIWGLDRIWQIALGVEGHYAIEVVELFDRSAPDVQDRTLLHELMHVPKTFSGALVPHNCFGKKINCDAEDEMYEKLEEARARERRVEVEPVIAEPPAALASPDAAPRPERVLDDYV